MNSVRDTLESQVSSGELRMELERLLSNHFGTERYIVRLERRPSAYCTSFAIEELDIRLDDGTVLQLIFKNLSRQALLEDARRTKPAFLYNPLREIETYHSILTSTRLGTATCYGTIADERVDRYWLFLEKVQGIALYQAGEFETWQKVAHWLAIMHSHFFRETETLRQTAPLLYYTEDFYRLWLRRARLFLCQTSQSESTRQGIERLASRYDKVVDRLVKLPMTFLHGEFYASNMLVQDRGEELRVCPVDWEMAAVGVGLIDLAALTSGGWSKEERVALAMAYWDALIPDCRGLLTPNMFLEALTYCRLHLAVQWLGWSLGWSPPPEHRQHWLGEALCLAEEIGL